MEHFIIQSVNHVVYKRIVWLYSLPRREALVLTNCYIFPSPSQTTAMHFFNHTLRIKKKDLYTRNIKSNTFCIDFVSFAAIVFKIAKIFDS